MTHSPPVQGRDAAAEAAQASGVVIRELAEPAELEQVSRLLTAVWNREPTDRNLTVEMLRALSTTGHYVAGAFAGDRLIGAAVGFFASPEQHSLRSQITGVAADSTARSVGYALKLHQRAWALERGIDTITWTYDPLVRRNAYFNLAKLGARAVEYLPNFYGELSDRINAGDESDRLLVEWTQPAIGLDDGEPLPSILRAGADGAPRLGAWDGPRALVAVPADIETMRRDDPPLAHEWRLAVRQALLGKRIVTFRRTEGYVIDA
jgi:predicted GNAT superfamily acetyltransferase